MLCNISETKGNHRRFNGAQRTGTVQLTPDDFISQTSQAPQQNFKMEFPQRAINIYERWLEIFRLMSEITVLSYWASNIKKQLFFKVCHFFDSYEL